MSDPLGQEPNRRADLERLGIFGGTFDPIHLGHLICAEQLRQALNLDLVLFVPSNEPPHKPSTVPAAAEHRLAMLRIAIEDHQGFRDSDLEIRRGGVSYTIDTVLELRKSIKSEVEFWLLMGQDSYQDVSAWKEPEKIAAECFFGIACRPGYGHRAQPPVPGARATFVDITAVDISSTDVRTRLSEHRSIRYLVPRKVEDYIRAKRVYS